MLYRIFLLIPALFIPAVHAQEAAAPEAPPIETPAAAPAQVPPATQVPLDPAKLLSVGAPRSLAERDEMSARAATLLAESKERKDEAEKAHESAKVECWKKFLVSSCLEDARVAYRKDMTLSRRQEREAQTLQRNVRKYDALERARIRDEENARKEAANAKKAEQYRAKRAVDGKLNQPVQP